MSIVSEHNVCIVPFWLQKTYFSPDSKGNTFLPKEKKKSKNQFNFPHRFLN